ncbi:MAG: hypothetical protein ACTSRA_15755, partial [Promethearchaeota archaeon]
MYSENPKIPDWETVRSITDDLCNVLDSIEVDRQRPPDLRYKLAQTIANLRSEKLMEGNIDRSLLIQFRRFKLMTAGIL